MSRHDDTVRLRHMLEHATEAVEMARGRTRADLDGDRQFALAMTRLLEIVGEAAGRISEPTRGKMPSIPWPNIVGLRNRLVHAYDEVDLDVLWATVQRDLAPLTVELRAFLETGGAGNAGE